MSGSRRFRFILVFFVAIALLLAAARFVDLARALDSLEDYPWSGIYVILLLSLIYYLVKAIRWHILLTALDMKLPMRRSLLVYMAGQWFAVTPAGEFVRAYMLTEYGFSFSRGSAVVTIQILLDFLALAIVGSISSLWYHNSMTEIVVPFAVVLIGVVLLVAYAPRLTRQRSLSSIEALDRRFGPGKLVDFYRHSRQLVRFKPFTFGTALGVISVIVGASVLFEVCGGYAIQVTYGQSAYVYSLSQLLGGLSMLPHGLGVIEGTSVALFSSVGVDTSLAASAIILFRLATLGWSIALGGLALLALRTPLAGPLLPNSEESK